MICTGNDHQLLIAAFELDDVNLQSIGESGSEMMIRAQTKSQDEKEQMKAVNSIKQILGDKYEYRRVELVGPQVGGELKKAGIIASVIAVLACKFSPSPEETEDTWVQLAPAG